jgi:4-alpha-glucanotransferase
MRACGILLPVSSLPSEYGIGCFSKEAYEFVDQLHEAGQQYWQILPMGPTSYGDSPYQSFSAFAGNPYFIDLETLIEDGLLTREECDEADFGDNENYIDYEAIYNSRFVVLRKAFERWKKKMEEQGKNPKQQVIHSLYQETKEYCFYAAVKRHFGEKCWTEWDEDIRLRKPAAVKHYQELLADDILFYEFQQLMFDHQWKALKTYANEKGIRIIGDIPIYVAFDSADSWYHPELFQFDEQNQPTGVAGCPPDGFSATGQLWGNPLYRWDYHRKTDYEWWMRRIKYCFRMYDKVRVDHFRGFAGYYSIPAKEETAMNGTWKKGPGYGLFKKMKETFGELDIIAEDLGTLTPDVFTLLDKTAYPGMKVLEFAFNSWERNQYLPMFYDKNCVVYTGTHDNDTLQGWFSSISDADRDFAVRYLHAEDVPQDQIHWEFIRLAIASVADLAVIPMQDYLGLGSEARINTPSTLGDNWKWRMSKGDFSHEIIGKCRYLCELYERKGIADKTR